MGREHRLGRRRGERRASGQHLVGEDADGVDVGPVVHVRIGRGLLGRHVGGRAERDAERGERGRAARRAHCLGDAEVGDYGVAIGEQDIVGLDVAVDNAVPVGEGEGVHHLAQDLGGLRHRQLAFAGEFGPEGLAADERHDIVEQVARGGGAQERDDVRVLKSGGELDLALEALDVYGRARLRGQDLDDNLPAEPGLLGEEDTAHPAAAQLLQDAVGAAEGGLQALLEVGQLAGQLHGGPARAGVVEDGWTGR